VFETVDEQCPAAFLLLQDLLDFLDFSGHGLELGDLLPDFGDCV
jgi:hypothetical protein